ncbi:MAG: aldo/keto reductase [Chloroflexi bacterium]|nr:aldo/keto reductase [Chloroflexota bacterium]
MKYESVQGIHLPKIGFGTWNIGGGASANSKKDPASLAALRSALEIGYTHIDTAEMYAAGHAEELVGSVVKDMRLPRESLFITSKVLPSHLAYHDVLKACEASLRRLKMDYLDLYLIHWPHKDMTLSETFRALNKLVRDGKVRHLGVSNFDLPLLKQSQEYSERPIVTNQVPFSLSNRTYLQNGILKYCQRNQILLTAYSPLEEGRLANTRTVKDIARTHRATIHQIALAWIVSHPLVVTIPMSANPIHQKENFDAAVIELTDEEFRRLHVE